MEQMSRTKAIKVFFEAEPNGRRVTLDELKQLSVEDRQEIGDLVGKALGVEIVVTK